MGICALVFSLSANEFFLAPQSVLRDHKKESAADAKPLLDGVIEFFSEHVGLRMSRAKSAAVILALAQALGCAPSIIQIKNLDPFHEVSNLKRPPPGLEAFHFKILNLQSPNSRMMESLREDLYTLGYFKHTMGYDAEFAFRHMITEQVDWAIRVIYIMGNLDPAEWETALKHLPYTPDIRSGPPLGNILKHNIGQLQYVIMLIEEGKLRDLQRLIIPYLYAVGRSEPNPKFFFKGLDEAQTVELFMKLIGEVERFYQQAKTTFKYIPAHPATKLLQSISA